MSDDSAQAAAPHYRAFISYSHADGRFAGWLHRRLEAARLPGKQRLSPIFFDRAELAAGPDLSAQVRDALAQSAALLVIASPAARASHWVGQEIALFRALHPDRPVLAALTEGEPAAAFPEALLSHAGAAIEPLAADFRKGQDGKRLGLLKIIAGLTAQPLDRLVQRDAQTRQRRVMAVTAGAVLLSLILSAALVLAIRARADAERQRADAEGLVEFMLTDLRDKLKGVGRLDVMDAVNQRAMGYYADQRDLAALGPDSLDRRARVIRSMGEDDESRGHIDAAFAKYALQDHVTSALLAKDPDNPDRVFAKAESENRLALIETTRGNIAVGYPRFRKAKVLLDRLPQASRKPRWDALDSLVTGNLCAIGARVAEDPKLTIGHCQQAVKLAEVRARQQSDDGQSRYDLSFHYYWLGKALSAISDHRQANHYFAKSLATIDGLVAADPRNMRWHEAHMELCFTLATLARTHGRLADFNRYRALAERDAMMLTTHDPENRTWQDYQRKIAQLKWEKVS